jgi:hypothetical protein
MAVFGKDGGRSGSIWCGRCRPAFGHEEPFRCSPRTAAFALGNPIAYSKTAIHLWPICAPVPSVLIFPGMAGTGWTGLLSVVRKMADHLRMRCVQSRRSGC